MSGYGTGEIGAEILDFALFCNFNSTGRKELPSPKAYTAYYKAIYELPESQAKDVQEKFARAVSGATLGRPGFRVEHFADFISGSAILAEDVGLLKTVQEVYTPDRYPELVYKPNDQYGRPFSWHTWPGHFVTPSSFLSKDGKDSVRLTIEPAYRSRTSNIDYLLLSGTIYLYLLYATKDLDEAKTGFSGSEHSRLDWLEYFSRPGIKLILPDSLPNRNRYQKL